LAQALGIRRVVVPAYSSAFSAFGCLVSDLRYDRAQTFRAALIGLDPADLDDRFGKLEAEVRAPLASEGFRPEQIQIERSLDLRYAGQNYELEVPVAAGEAGDQIRARYNALHRARYTYATDEDVECVNLRVSARVPSRRVELTAADVDQTAAPIAEHIASFPELGRVRVPVYRRGEVGAPILGPALIEDANTTVVLCPGQQARADQWGHLYLEDVSA
jgi:N-methylhydantoinase A